MEIYIDNKRADTGEMTELSISLSVATVTDPRRGRSGYTRSIKLPMTPANDTIFGFAADVNVRDHFNSVGHTGRVEHEGAALFEGPLRLKKCETTREGISFYEIYIVGSAKLWASNATTHKLSTLAIDYNKRLTGEVINRSWSNDDPVKWLPVAREKQTLDYSSGYSVPAMKMLTSDDYHPFLHAATLLRAIFAASGYTVVSDFVDGDEFANLYISGMYHTRDVAIMKANMDFLARTSTPRRATANSQGRVYADPYLTGFTIGNLVDEAEFSNNECWGWDDDRVVFTPTSAVSMGFQYHLKYTTDYAMKSSTELTGFDTLYLGEDVSRKLIIPNPHKNRVNGFRASASYLLAVFDRIPGYQYQFCYVSITNESTMGSILIDVTGTFTPIIIRPAMLVFSPEIIYRTSQTSVWQTYTGDWALYDGYVSERGTMDIEVTVRTAPEPLTPGRPKFFDNIIFAGAQPGMAITVSDKTWVRPVFYAQPTEGSILTFNDVCAHDAYRMEFIDALRQMFNLRFQTDNRNKTVRIEPADRFFSGAHTIDWTGRIDHSKPIEIEDLSGELAHEMLWSYQGGQLGSWSVILDNPTATVECSEWQNQMFTPTLCAKDLFYNAPSAMWVQPGEMAKDVLDRTENLNFEPTIVRYEGLKPLPDGECWGWPREGATVYPKIAFHAPESGYTLCFDDRDGVVGLHRHYDHQVRLWNRSRRVSAWIALDAIDIESISFPTGHGANFSALYSLTIDGESGLYRLEQVCDYSPDAPSTKCVFIKHIP